MSDTPSPRHTATDTKEAESGQAAVSDTLSVHQSAADSASGHSESDDVLSATPEDTPSPYPFYPGQPTVPDGTKAIAGSPLAEDEEKAELADIIAALKTVHDPEIPVNIHDLGLIYSCDMDESGDVEIFMTLTAPACPVAGQMPQEVATTVAAVDGVGTVTVTLTWQPPWNQDRMSDDARLALGFF